MLRIVILSFNCNNRISIIFFDIPWNRYPLIPDSSFTLGLKRISIRALCRFMYIRESWRVRNYVFHATTLLNGLFASRPLRDSTYIVIKWYDSKKITVVSRRMHTSKEPISWKDSTAITQSDGNLMNYTKVTFWRRLCECMCARARARVCVCVYLMVPKLSELKRAKMIPCAYAMALINIPLQWVAHPRDI